MLKRTCGVESWRRRETCALGPLMVVGRILELEKKRRTEKQGLNYVVGKKRRTKGAASVAVAGERKGKRDTKINCLFCGSTFPKLVEFFYSSKFK